jgi:hypothetical protein
VATLAAAACSSPPALAGHDGGGADGSIDWDGGSAASLRASPVDRTSAWAAGFPTVVVASGVVDGTQLAALRSAAFIETWPALTPVAAVATVAPDGRSIGIVPVSPLAAGWHVFGVRSLPARVEWGGESPFLTLPDGSRGYRFRTDSYPIVWGIVVCDKANGTVVATGFSEPVLGALGAKVTVTNTSGAAAGCTLLQGPTPTQSQAGVDTLCTSLEGALEVTISSGFASPGGIPLRDLAGNPLAYQVVRSQLPPWDTGCGMFWP